MHQKRAQREKVVAAHQDVAMPEESPNGVANAKARIHPDLQELSNDWG